MNLIYYSKVSKVDKDCQYIFALLKHFSHCIALVFLQIPDEQIVTNTGFLCGAINQTGGHGVAPATAFVGKDLTSFIVTSCPDLQHAAVNHITSSCVFLN